MKPSSRPMSQRNVQRSMIANALRAAFLAVSGLALRASPALAGDLSMPQASTAASAVSPGSKDAGDKPAWAGDLSTRSNLLGDSGGIRPMFEGYGISFGLNETTEVLGNPMGGVKRGAIVEGLTQMSVGIDLAKAMGFQGGLFNVSAFQIHGRGLSSENVRNLNVVSSIEADPATRLNELWFQQSFVGGKFDVKVGQQSADLEFITSEYEDLFINSGFGWPTLPAVDLPSGGPAYPLPTPGIRLRAKPSDSINVLLGLYDGSPAGLRPGDPQVNDPSGTNFDVSSGYFLIGEAQYRTNQEKDAEGLPATYKVGVWYNSNSFKDPFFTNGAIVPAEGPFAVTGGSLHGDWSAYGTLDQIVYRPSGADDGGLGITARAMGGPGDRNLVDVFAQGGLTYKGVFDRPNDTMGIGVEWAHVSSRARAGDLATAEVLGTSYPLRSDETVVEVTYQAQIAPWWQVQPDVQYVLSPGGGVPDPDRLGHRIGDALVLGARSVVTF